MESAQVGEVSPLIIPEGEGASPGSPSARRYGDGESRSSSTRCHRTSTADPTKIQSGAKRGRESFQLREGCQSTGAVGRWNDRTVQRPTVGSAPPAARPRRRRCGYTAGPRRRSTLRDVGCVCLRILSVGRDYLMQCQLIAMGRRRTLGSLKRVMAVSATGRLNGV